MTILLYIKHNGKSVLHGHRFHFFNADTNHSMLCSWAYGLVLVGCLRNSSLDRLNICLVHWREACS